MRLITVVVLLVASLALAIPAGATERSYAASTHVVRIQGIDFHPHVLTIARGAAVQWVWRDGNTPHNVTSRGAQRFRSSPSRTSGTWTVRFTRPGTYRYVCTIHFGMKARVVVR